MLRRCQAIVHGWQQDAYRRVANETGASTDAAAWQFVAVVSLTLFACKTWLLEGLPGLAILSSSHGLIAQGLVLLIRWRRELYVQHRELLFSAALLNLVLVVQQLALYGGTVIVVHHRDSGLCLLALMVVASSAIWLFLYSLHARFVAVRMGPALVGLSLLSLWSNTRVCERQLGVPGVEGPMRRLHATLGMLHSCTSSAALLLWNPGTPLQQCRAINTWVALALGALLPIWLLLKLERHSRAAFLARLQRQQRQHHHQWHLWQDQQSQQQRQQQQQQRLDALGNPERGMQAAAAAADGSPADSDPLTEQAALWSEMPAQGSSDIGGGAMHSAGMLGPGMSALDVYLTSSLLWYSANALAAD